MENKNMITKTAVEQGQGIAGFLIPVEVLPENLSNYHGSTPFKMQVTGAMVTIEGVEYFRVEAWHTR